jgi:hypothetical protein
MFVCLFVSFGNFNNFSVFDRSPGVHVVFTAVTYSSAMVMHERVQRVGLGTIPSASDEINTLLLLLAGDKQ